MSDYPHKIGDVIFSRQIDEAPAGFFHAYDFESVGGAFRVVAITSTHVFVRVVRSDGSLGEQARWSHDDSLRFRVVMLTPPRLAGPSRLRSLVKGGAA